MIKFKNIIIIFLNIILINSFYPQQKENSSEIVKLYETGVVYIEQSLYFKETDFKNIEIFKDLESKYNVKFINEYILISSGTGFFITNTGYIITNNHVIDKTDLKNARKKILNYLMFELNKKMTEKEFESKYNSIYNDLKNLTEKSEHFYRVIAENKDNYIAEIIKTNSSFDLALMKIEGGKFNFLPLGNIENLNIADQVIAIG
ncbi:MAG: trypsin-like peptidase domain-containing protein [Spirochaetes bacterium]|nr:trypsin-like peptidase domain-containing protein [Spirochaetota bacterium]